jgi:hypothetical protein
MVMEKCFSEGGVCSSVSFCHSHSKTSPCSFTHPPPKMYNIILATDSFKFMSNIFPFFERVRVVLDVLSVSQATLVVLW